MSVYLYSPDMSFVEFGRLVWSMSSEVVGAKPAFDDLIIWIYNGTKLHICFLINSIYLEFFRFYSKNTGTLNILRYPA